MQTLPLIIVVVYMLAMMAVGWLVGKKQINNSKASSPSSWSTPSS